jgi:hypothetical protein
MLVLKEVLTVENANAEVLLIAIISVTFLSALLGTVIALSMARRWHRYQPNALSHSQVPAVNPSVIPLSVPQVQAVAIPKRITIPNPYRIPTQQGSLDQVILSIEPSDGPNRDQRNVQKLIEFLKSEIATVEQRAS